MINFLKKHWLFVILGAIAALLVGLYYILPREETIDESLPKLERLEIDGINLNPNTRITFSIKVDPKTLPILNLKRRTSLITAEMRSFAEKLGFSGEPKGEQDIISGPIYIWSNNKYLLSIYPQIIRIEYELDLISNPPPQLGVLPEPTVAKEKLFALFRQLEIPTEGVSFEQKERYYSVNDLGFYVVSKDKASILELNFNPIFNQTPIVTNSPEAQSITATFNKGGNIVGFKFQVPIALLAAGHPYLLKNLDDIKNSTYTEGKILQATLDYQGTTLEDVNLISINISKINLAYFLDDKTDIIQPIYIMHGLAQDSRNESHKIQIYLPAIKSEYFKQAPAP